MRSIKQTALYNKHGNSIPAKTIYLNIYSFCVPVSSMDSVFELAKTYANMTSTNCAQICIYGADAFRLGELRELRLKTPTGSSTIKAKCQIKNASIKNIGGGSHGKFNTNVGNAK